MKLTKNLKRRSDPSDPAVKYDLYFVLSVCLQKTVVSGRFLSTYVVQVVKTLLVLNLRKVFFSSHPFSLLREHLCELFTQV